MKNYKRLKEKKGKTKDGTKSKEKCNQNKERT